MIAVTCASPGIIFGAGVFLEVLQDTMIDAIKIIVTGFIMMLHYTIKGYLKKQFEFSPIQENTYILYNEFNECIIIDPGCYYDAEFEWH